MAEQDPETSVSKDIDFKKVGSYTWVQYRMFNIRLNKMPLV